MPRSARISRETLAPLVRARGPISASELAALLGVDRTTVVRRLSDFGDELVTLGATRSTRYLLRQGVRDIGNRWPVYRLGADGRASEWAQLEALCDGLWRIHWSGNPPEWAGHFTEGNGLWSGFPFFLGDVRPQGFLGRMIAGQVSKTLQLPDDPRMWGDADIIYYLQVAGEDLTGDVVVGDECLRRALAGSANLPGGNVTRETDRGMVYPARASMISRNLPGSSAGGEQPKFLTTLQTGDDRFVPVLVKFSAPLEQETGRRWADLLACELHAHEVLAEAGLSVPGARLVDAGGRRFLEVPRFDRSGASGRLGVVSLEALASASVGLVGDWTATVDALVREGLVDFAALETVRLLQSFGELIGNTDMHSGNLAFFLADTLPLRVTPSYDMLPMLWAPGVQGEIVERSFAPAPPLPSSVGSWRAAAGMAEDFWRRTVADDRISVAFREMAGQALESVRQLRRHVG